MNPYMSPGVRKTVAMASVLAAMALAVLDAAIANVALPSISKSLQVSPSASIRIISAYQVALVVALLPLAAIGESLGYRRIFTVGVAVFTAASMLCALSPSLQWLIAARFVQGLGGAAIMALGVALLRFAVPREQLGAAIGWNATTVALASAAGPTIATMVLSHAQWPWLFAINLPMGIIALSATRALPDVAGTRHRLELSRVIPFDLLSCASMRVSVLASVLCFSGQTAGLIALPFYLQHSLGYDAWMTGLLMTSWPLTVAVVAPLAGKWADRVSTASLCAAGGAILALGLAGAALWPWRDNCIALVASGMLCGVGFGLFQVSNNRNLLLSAPRERAGAAGGIQGTARLIGQTSGAGILSLLFALAPVAEASRFGLAIGAVLTLLAGWVSTFRLEGTCPSAPNTTISLQPL